MIKLVKSDLLHTNLTYARLIMLKRVKSKYVAMLNLSQSKTINTYKNNRFDILLCL